MYFICCRGPTVNFVFVAIITNIYGVSKKIVMIKCIISLRTRKFVNIYYVHMYIPLLALDVQQFEFCNNNDNIYGVFKKIVTRDQIINLHASRFVHIYCVLYLFKMNYSFFTPLFTYSINGIIRSRANNKPTRDQAEL